MDLADPQLVGARKKKLDDPEFGGRSKKIDLADPQFGGCSGKKDLADQKKNYSFWG